MKIFNRILPVMLAVVLVFSTVISALAMAPSDSEGQAGQIITVKFQYTNIAGIEGQFIYSSPELFSDIQLSKNGLNSGSYNPSNNKISFFEPQLVESCSINLILTISETAKAGDTCTITLKYRTGDENGDISQWKEDVAVITVKETVDYNALIQLIAKAELLNKKDYTLSSWMLFSDALDAARKALSAETQKEVDAAYNALEYAMEFLVKRERIDYSLLKHYITVAEDLKETEYTAASWSVLAKALQDGRAALNSKKQTTVDLAASALESAINGLVRIPDLPSVDYSALVKQIRIASGLNEDDYTQNSWRILESALTDANKALTSDSQNTVDSATTELRNAIASLVPLNGDENIDYSELTRLIAIAEGLNESQYTSKSWEKLKKALIEAKKALSSVSQQTVDSSADKLKQAISNLEFNSSSVDYSELLKQIQIAESLKAPLYTSSSWNNLIVYLAEARLATASLSQAEVDTAAEALSLAIESLVAMDYSGLIDAIEQVSKFIDKEELAELIKEMTELLDKARELLDSGDQGAVDDCAKQLNELLTKIAKKLSELKETVTITVEKPVPTDPKGDYCNINSHYVWQILFWVSLSLNLVFLAVIIIYYILKRRKTTDDTPLVDYDISDDAE